MHLYTANQMKLESIEIAYGLSDEIQSTSTEKSSPKLLAEPCTQRDNLEQFPRDHVNRANYCLLPDSPVFSVVFCELDQPSYPVNPSPQPDHLVQHFAGDWHSAKSPQQLAISPAIPFAHCLSHKVILLKPVQQNGHILTSKTGIYSDTLSDVQDELLYSVDMS